MGFVNSPPKQVDSNAGKTVRKDFKAFLLQVLRRTRGFLEAQKLPYVAHKACEIYLGETHKVHQAKCRRILRTRLEVNPAQLQRFLHTSVGNDLLGWLARFFHLPGTQNQKHALQDLLLQMAADPDGFSFLSFLRRTPHSIQPNLEQLLITTKQVEWLLKAAEATLEIVRELAAAEAQTLPTIEVAGLPELRRPGPYPVKQFNLRLEAGPQTAGSNWLTQLQVVCYQPDPWPIGPIPVIVQSHGLASAPEDLATYAEHLASYGYFVVAPCHPGSDVEQLRNLLSGNSQEVFQLTEFIDRPLAVRALLDELERQNLSRFEGRLNLSQVGVMGCSFGAYTALALAGADLQFDQLEPACGLTRRNPNISLLLQCQALGLPRQTYDFRDDRIQAVISIDAVGSELFGPQGIAPIQVPVLLIAGNQDVAAPLVLEQVRLFRWLTAPHFYLALMQGKSHIQDMKRLISTLNLQIKTSPEIPSITTEVPFEQYIQAISLAFFNQHLLQREDAEPYLSAAYASAISSPPFAFWLLNQTSRPELDHRLQEWENPIEPRENNGG
ncbi:hypothetical protein BST81_26010 [Leptolyngbya sp. 'hensonii']|uniref:alpha/beta hydrolase n=1 Tax=Leptolyngbya sp. 'hensonii' TaxID=1922337 RepID=UPI00094FBE8E|nr:alpha/beta hydrolase [Leptolyngbya sp. 'hensonii']OLP15479.1 hypothetical protein BST81_26010 [Leptolyngbya sp. 'hensonii']